MLYLPRKNLTVAKLEIPILAISHWINQLVLMEIYNFMKFGQIRTESYKIWQWQDRTAEQDPWKTQMHETKSSVSKSICNCQDLTEHYMGKVACIHSDNCWDQFNESPLCQYQSHYNKFQRAMKSVCYIRNFLRRVQKYIHSCLVGNRFSFPFKRVFYIIKFCNHDYTDL